MAFGNLVDAKVFGGAPGRMVYPAIVRTLVFSEGGVPVESEIAKTKPIPQNDDLTVIYLDSFDQLRRLDKGCARALKEGSLERRQEFLRVCQEKGLPFNNVKSLVSSTQGTKQGGELDGEKGRRDLAQEKMAGLIDLGGRPCSAWTSGGTH